VSLNDIKDLKTCDKLSALVSSLIIMISCVDIVRYILLGQPVALTTMLIVNVLFILCALAAFFGRVHPLYLPIAFSACVLFFTTNNMETTLFNFSFLLQAVLGAVGSIGGTIICVVHKEKPRKIVTAYLVIALALAAVSCGVWGVGNRLDAAKTAASPTLWSVPTAFDEAACPEAGTIERVDYATKAYATDGRTVYKSAFVYLPFGYDGMKHYNILYLMHGTGDNEAYWLVENEYNKTMVDNLIYQKEIEPLIIVTPTFYVEDDCLDGLDPLTYSFKDELRNDLMPVVEGKYSTFAQSCDAEGFQNSRSHRAFAGLSRGAVTTLHSVFCGCLDYFSTFGTFSASRTPVQYFVENIQSDEFQKLPIDYWYLASGAFDFGLKSQVEDYTALLRVEPRLCPGENTSFDVFPMRYHSIGNWHLALYNFLQHIF